MTDPTRATLPVLRRAAALAYLAAGAVLLALLAWNHVQLVTTPVPLDYYEGAMQQLTQVFAAGHNPYTRAFQPASADVYPPLYNLVVAPFALLFGNTLPLHRLVSGVFIIGSCAAAFLATRRAGGTRANSLACAALVYAALLFYATPIASTNAIGVFMFLLSVLLPWLRGFDRRGLCASLVCGVLGFYSKQYCIVGLVFVGGWLFLAVSPRVAIIFGAAAAALAGGSLIAVHLASPYFLDNTVFAVASAVGAYDSFVYVYRQLIEFAITYAALLAMLVLLAGLRLRRHLAAGTLRETPAALLRRALSPATGPLYIWYCFACATLVIVLALGRNPGNFMTYLYQLMSPFLLIGTLSLPALQGRRAAFLYPFVLATFARAYLVLPRDFAIDPQGWARIDAIIAAGDHILASPILIGPLVDNGKRVYHNGHTFYFRRALEKPAYFRQRDPALRVDAVWNTFIRGMYDDVAAQRFDCILANSWDMNGIFTANPPPGSELDGLSYVQQFYTLRETVSVAMPVRPGGGSWPIQVWVPKDRPGTCGG